MKKLLILLLSCTALNAFAAADYYLEIEGVKGESTASQQPQTQQQQPAQQKKRIDKATPQLSKTSKPEDKPDKPRTQR